MLQKKLYHKFKHSFTVSRSHNGQKIGEEEAEVGEVEEEVMVVLKDHTDAEDSTEDGGGNTSM